MTVRVFYFILFILCSCTPSSKKKDTIRVSVLRGPSAIAFAQWIDKTPEIDGRSLTVQIVDSPDLMQAALIKGEADIAALPMISAVNLYNKGIRYPLIGCPVWGTLYLIGKEQAQEDHKEPQTLYIFGSGTTPDILTRYYLKQHHLSYTLNYSFPTAYEIMQGLLAGKIETAVLGEPFLSMALGKDHSLRIIADLNAPDHMNSGFAQTAVIIAPDLTGKAEKINRLLEESCRFATEKPEDAIQILEKHQVFNTGMLTPTSIKRCKINYLPVSDAREDIERFLQIINEYEPKALGGKLPDQGFFNE